jgi:membrane-associated protein
VTIESFLITQGSALILPLSVIEGPVVSVLAGFLAGLGYFRWYWVICLLICGDLIGDLIYYWIGRSGGSSLAGIGQRLGLYRSVPADVQEGLRQNAAKMLFIGKWTQTLGCVVLIGSGMLRLPLRRFMILNLLATVPKSTVLFCVGYFAGSHLLPFERHMLLGTIALCVLGMTAITLVLWRADGIRFHGTDE